MNVAARHAEVSSSPAFRRIVQNRFYEDRLRRVQKRKLPAFKVGSAWRFLRRDIDAWAKEHVRAHRGRKSVP